jgi:hypothetical protein
MPINLNQTVKFLLTVFMTMIGIYIIKKLGEKYDIPVVSEVSKTV